VPSPNRDSLVHLDSKIHCIRLENCTLLGYYATSNGNNTEGCSYFLIRGGSPKSCDVWPACLFCLVSPVRCDGCLSYSVSHDLVILNAELCRTCEMIPIEIFC